MPGAVESPDTSFPDGGQSFTRSITGFGAGLIDGDEDFFIIENATPGAQLKVTLLPDVFFDTSSQTYLAETFAVPAGVFQFYEVLDENSNVIDSGWESFAQFNFFPDAVLGGSAYFLQTTFAVPLARDVDNGATTTRYYAEYGVLLEAGEVPLTVLDPNDLNSAIPLPFETAGRYLLLAQNPGESIAGERSAAWGGWLQEADLSQLIADAVGGGDEGGDDDGGGGGGLGDMAIEDLLAEIPESARLELRLPEETGYGQPIYESHGYDFDIVDHVAGSWRSTEANTDEIISGVPWHSGSNVDKFVDVVEAVARVEAVDRFTEYFLERGFPSTIATNFSIAMDGIYNISKFWGNWVKDTTKALTDAINAFGDPNSTFSLSEFESRTDNGKQLVYDIVQGVSGEIASAAEKVENSGLFTFNSTLTYGFVFGEAVSHIEAGAHQLGFVGTPLNDTAVGGAMADLLYGAEGDDRLIGEAGDDYLAGGKGSDLVEGRLGADTIHGGDGDDALFGAIFFQPIDPFFLPVLIDPNADVLDGGAGDDYLNGGDGVDTLIGGDGFDRVSFFTLDATQGASANLSTQTVANDGYGNSEILSSIEGLGNGTAFSDTLIGDDGPNHIIVSTGDIGLGLGGDDSFTLGGAPAILDGGTGVNRIIGVYRDRLLPDSNADGIAEIEFSVAGVTIDLALETFSDAFGGFGTFQNIHHAVGSAGADTVLGNESGNELGGAGGDDVINGFGGDDTVAGGLGSDTLNGGDDFDLLDYRDAGGAVIVNLGTGSSTEYDTASRFDTEAMVTGADTFSGFEGIIGGAFEDLLTGGAGNDDLDGSAGRDILLGLGGQDTLIGGDGSDTLSGGAGNDSLDGGAGFDTANYASAAAGVVVTLAGGVASNDGDGGADTLVSIEAVTGSGFADAIVGSNEDNLLDGGAGNDTLSGGGGDDLLFGGPGFDTLDGGAGNDTVNYILETGPIVIDLENNDAVNVTSGDVDTLISIENAFGSAAGDLIVGTAGANILDGYFGDDQLFGLGGDDVLSGGSGADTISGGAGEDTVDYRSVLSGVNLTLNTIVVDDGFGFSDTITDVENVIGSEFVDQIVGSGEANTLYGLAGDDVLSGAGGDDTLLGYEGFDTLNGGAGVDVVDYSVAGMGVIVDLSLNTAVNDGEGYVDTILLVESVVGSAFEDFITGDDLDNSLTGLGKGDFLDGRHGSDILDGGDGNDTLRGGGGSDVLIGGGGDNDTADYSDATRDITVDLRISGPQPTGRGMDSFTGIENVIGAAFGDTLIGNSANNHLYGHGGNDVLDGRFGRDILEGGAGADLLTGGNGNDVLQGGKGNDVLASGPGVNDTADYSDALNAVVVDLRISGAQNTRWGNDTLSGFERIQGSAFSDTLIADAGNNRLFGGSGADELRGQFGKDVLDGGAGGDVMIGGAGADTFVFNHVTDISINSDRILDLAANDFIDLSPIETIDGVDLKFIGKSGFSGSAGEFRYGKSGGETQIKIDIDGDGSPDRFIDIENGEFDLRETSSNSLVLQIDPSAAAAIGAIAPLESDDAAPAGEPGQHAMLGVAWMDDPTAAWLL